MLVLIELATEGHSVVTKSLHGKKTRHITGSVTIHRAYRKAQKKSKSESVPSTNHTVSEMERLLGITIHAVIKAVTTPLTSTNEPLSVNNNIILCVHVHFCLITYVFVGVSLYFLVCVCVYIACVCMCLCMFVFVCL